MSDSTKTRLTPAQELEALRRSEQAGALVMSARNAHRKGDKEKAKELLKEAFALTPGDPAAIDLLGDIYFEEGETEKASQLFERAVQMHPGNQTFEEKLAIAHLDLAEMESEKLAKQHVLHAGDTGKIFDRVPSKAFALSLLLPGAGQFYNDEIEKGAAFLAAAILTCIGWAYPLLTAMNSLPGTDKFKLELALNSLNGFSGQLFWPMLLFWLMSYTVSCIDAGLTASRLNEERRRSLGL